MPLQAARDSGRIGAQERILRAAADLFAQSGYYGTSTREIASVARVNEVTIYRHYPSKRELFLAVMVAELQKITLHGDVLTKLAHAPNGRSALALTIQLITITLQQQGNLLRLVQYSSLELNEDLDPLLRHHLGELLEVVSRYLEPWIDGGQLRCTDAKSLLLTLIAMVTTHQSLHRVFSGTAASPDFILDAYAQGRNPS